MVIKNFLNKIKYLFINKKEYIVYNLKCTIGFKLNECERYNIVKTCKKCPWYE